MFGNFTALARTYGLVLGAFILISGASSSALAAAIEEVIVTAQRASESIQDVPISVTALSGDILEDRQILSATALQMNGPNV